MSRFIHYLKDSQRGHRSCLVFSFKKPSLYQSRLKQKWFFEPYRSKRISKWSKYDKFVELWYHFGYPILSIFVDIAVLRDRYIRLNRAIDLYINWTFTRSRWYQYWERKLKYHVLPILGGIGFYVVIQGFYIFWPSIVRLYKKKIWWNFYNFIWFSLIKKFLFLFFFFIFILAKVLYFFVLIFFSFLFLFSFFFFTKRIFLYLFLIKNNSVFARGLLVSSLSGFKYTFKKSTRAVRDIYRLGWRLSPSLTNRFALVSNRFEEYQFPFSRQDDSIFLDFWGVEGSGWLQFESTVSRLDFYNSSLPSLIFKRKKRRKWFSLNVPARFLSVWSRRPNRRFDMFYARNFILYTRWGESAFFKTRVNYYETFLLKFLMNFNSFKDLSIKTIQPAVYKIYPWWFYKQKLFLFLYLKFIFLYHFTFYKDTAPVRGDLVSVYRRRFRNLFHPLRHYYSVNTYFTAFINLKLRQFSKPWANTVFFLNSDLYQSFWLRLNMFLDAFSWSLLLPVVRRFKLKKNNILKVSFFLFFLFLILLI